MAVHSFANASFLFAFFTVIGDGAVGVQPVTQFKIFTHSGIRGHLNVFQNSVLVVVLIIRPIVFTAPAFDFISALKELIFHKNHLSV